MSTYGNAGADLLIALAITVALWSTCVAGARPEPVASSPSWAICPIVYPLDQSPSDRGFHYVFYGNGFFVNDDGYLLTAAHVLSQLGDNPPYVVLRLPEAPSRFLKASVVAVDRDHDTALLEVTPNPFRERYQVRFLPLSEQRPSARETVQAIAVRPSRLRDPHTFDAFTEDRPEGRVLEYEFSQLEKGRPDTELLLFAHDVLLGDSGAPVISGESGAVVGLIEGRWLRTEAVALATRGVSPSSGVSAAVPIRYAIDLLERQGVHWHATNQYAPD